MSQLRKWLATAGCGFLLLLSGNGMLHSAGETAVAQEDAGAPGIGASDSQGAPYVKRSSSAIALTADGATLLAVNPDSNSLSLVELGGPPQIFEVAVGKDPRTVAVSDDGRRAYTANRGSGSVSAVDLGSRQVIGEIALGAQPYGVVLSPDGGSLFVAVQGNDRLVVVDTATLTVRLILPLSDRPSGLAISDDGHDLYVTHLLSNRITYLSLPIPRIFLPFISRRGPGAQTRTTPSPDAVAGHRALGSGIRLWPNSNLVQSIVIAPGGSRAYVPHTRSNSGNDALTLETTVAPIVSVVDVNGRQHLLGEQFNLEMLDPPAVGLPFDAAITPDGAELWVLNAASNDITVIDLQTRQRVAHVEVGDNPRGIVISPDGSTAYVDNTLSGSISLVDTSTYTETAVIPTTTIPLDPVLLTGKRLFNSSDDPRMGQDQWISCNTCHFDGQNDGQTWLLGFAGPRNTSSLLGMGQTLPLRWSGEWDEAADAEFAIRMDSFGTGLIGGEMHCSLDPPDCVNQPPHAGLSADLDALAAYISSLRVPLSPGHGDGQPLSAREQRGRSYFLDPALGCASCHPPPLYTDNLAHDVGTATQDERIGPVFNTPSLRALYDTAPYFHDGSAATLYQAITRSSGNGEHDVSGVLDEGQIQDLIAFLLTLPYEE